LCLRKIQEGIVFFANAKIAPNCMKQKISPLPCPSIYRMFVLCNPRFILFILTFILRGNEVSKMKSLTGHCLDNSKFCRKFELRFSVGYMITYYIQETDLDATDGVSRVTDGSGLCAWNMVCGVAG